MGLNGNLQMRLHESSHSASHTCAIQCNIWIKTTADNYINCKPFECNQSNHIRSINGNNKPNLQLKSPAFGTKDFSFEVNLCSVTENAVIFRKTGMYGSEYDNGNYPSVDQRRLLITFIKFIQDDCLFQAKKRMEGWYHVSNLIKCEVFCEPEIIVTKVWV